MSDELKKLLELCWRHPGWKTNSVENESYDFNRGARWGQQEMFIATHGQLRQARGLLLKYKDVYRTHQHTKFKNDGSHLQADIAMNELLAEIEEWLAGE